MAVWVSKPLGEPGTPRSRRRINGRQIRNCLICRPFLRSSWSLASAIPPLQRTGGVKPERRPATHPERPRGAPATSTRDPTSQRPNSSASHEAAHCVVLPLCSARVRLEPPRDPPRSGLGLGSRSEPLHGVRLVRRRVRVAAHRDRFRKSLKWWRRRESNPRPRSAPTSSPRCRSSSGRGPRAAGPFRERRP